MHCLTGDDVTLLKEEIRKKFSIDASNECVSGSSNYYEWKTFLVCTYINLIPIPAYITILVLRKLTISKLSIQTAMSQGTKHLHSQLLLMLTFQASLPMTLLLGSFAYAIGQSDIYHHPLLEYSLSFVTVPVPALNSIVSLYFIGPYRIWIRDSLLCWKKPVPITTVHSIGTITFVK
ncbi:hypothetical protein OSTOST_01220 [Ostertagia ostertagi]